MDTYCCASSSKTSFHLYEAKSSLQIINLKQLSRTRTRKLGIKTSEKTSFHLYEAKELHRK